MVSITRDDAIWLLAAESDAAEFDRHSDSAITLRVYSHVMEEHGRDEVLRATASLLAARSEAVSLSQGTARGC